MKRPLLVAAMLFVTPALLAQTPADRATAERAAWDSARFAWEGGRYPDALEGLDRLLAGPRADSSLRSVALLTGEYFTTRELAQDGRRVRWSADGRWASFESGTGAERAITFVPMGGSRNAQAVSVAGSGAVFAPTGAEVAWLHVPETPPLARLRVRLDSLIAAEELQAAQRYRADLLRLEGTAGTVRVRNLATGRERTVAAPSDLVKTELAWTPDGRSLLVTGVRAGGREPRLYLLSNGSAAPVDTSAGPKQNVQTVPGAQRIVYTSGTNIVVRDLANADVRTFAGAEPTVSADGSTMAWIVREASRTSLMAAPVAGGQPRTIIVTDAPVAAPALSPSGRTVVWQMMAREDWELFVAPTAAGEPRRLTNEIQHDLFPRFVGEDRVFAVIGEGRHRRSHLHDVASGERTRLFHNNTIRTVAPEYEWAVSPDATKVLIVSERDGDTISPERGVYLMDLTRPVTVAAVRERLAAMSAHEADLRARGEATFRPIADQVRAAVADVSVDRIYDYEKALHRLGSKYIGTPGNLHAIEYIAGRLREFGYEPEIQWFEAEGHRTANVIATLRGTQDPGLVYVVSSHFDSVEEGPGADDNSSGTTALLEAARALSTRPQAATIRFAWFTGEEAGLYGSREFVRRAVADSVRLVGALNNDMIGFANDQRLDNTIRYSNPGIRDLQHAAAFLFTDLITYDAKYYKNTDAHAYYEEYGDIVGGIGSYPILGNPHYHQSHDVLETIDHRLVAEVSRTTLASLMAMASRPSRLTGLEVTRRRGAADVTWQPAPESGVARYVVTWGPVGGGEAGRTEVTEPRARIPGLAAGAEIRVKAVSAAGVDGWDWARTVAR